MRLSLALWVVIHALRFVLPPPSRLWLAEQQWNRIKRSRAMILLSENARSLLRLLADPIHERHYHRLFLAWCGNATPAEYAAFVREIIPHLNRQPIARLLISYDCWLKTHNDRLSAFAPMPSDWLLAQMPHSPAMTTRMSWTVRLEAMGRTARLPEVRGVNLADLIYSQHFGLIEPSAKIKDWQRLSAMMRDTGRQHDRLHLWWLKWARTGQTGQFYDASLVDMTPPKDLRAALEWLTYRLLWGKCLVEESADLFERLFTERTMIPSTQFALLLKAARGTFFLASLISFLGFDPHLAIRVGNLLTRESLLHLPLSLRIDILRKHLYDWERVPLLPHQGQAQAEDVTHWFIGRLERLKRRFADEEATWQANVEEAQLFANMLRRIAVTDYRLSCTSHPHLLEAMNKLVCLSIALHLPGLRIELAVDFLWQLEHDSKDKVVELAQQDLQFLSDRALSQRLLLAVQPLSLYQVSQMLSERLQPEGEQMQAEVPQVDVERVAMQSWRWWRDWWMDLKELLGGHLTTPEIISLLSITRAKL